jgi:hypothetical protein
MLEKGSSVPSFVIPFAWMKDYAFDWFWTVYHKYLIKLGSIIVCNINDNEMVKKMNWSLLIGHKFVATCIIPTIPTIGSIFCWFYNEWTRWLLVFVRRDLLEEKKVIWGEVSWQKKEMNLDLATRWNMNITIWSCW